MVVERYNRGDGAIQIGHVGGNLTIVQVVQGAPATPRTKGLANEAQREVLKLMRHLPDQALVTDFMQREFDTRMVIDLDAGQLFRVRRYVETILNNSDKAGIPATQRERRP